MHVRKFEADTMDEALKAIKFELGPDAIIIKTVTNSGVKGAFKKKKIEITAAISEDDFQKKRKIDKILTNDQKKDLYSQSSQSINQVINQYSRNDTSAKKTEMPQEKNAAPSSSGLGYGKLALNKTVKKTEQNSDLTFDSSDHELDSFLTQNTSETIEHDTNEKHFEMRKFHQPEARQEAPEQGDYWDLKQRVEEQNSYLHRLKEDMDILRLKLEEESFHPSADSSEILKQMYTTLKTFDIDQQLLKNLMEEVRSRFNDETTEDDLWAHAISKIKSIIKIKKPNFATSEQPVVTLFVSEGASGQSSLIYKLVNKVKRAHVILYMTNPEQNIQDKYTEKLVGVDVTIVSRPSDLVTAIKDTLTQGTYPFIDMKIRGQDYANVKSLFSVLRKSFSNVEVISCLSSIHSELYNKKFLHQMHREIDYVCFTHTDLCLNWVTMMNIHSQFGQIPMAYLSSGPSIPNDISEISSEEFIRQMFGL